MSMITKESEKPIEVKKENKKIIDVESKPIEKKVEEVKKKKITKDDIAEFQFFQENCAKDTQKEICRNFMEYEVELKKKNLELTPLKVQSVTKTFSSLLWFLVVLTLVGLFIWFIVSIVIPALQGLSEFSIMDLFGDIDIPDIPEPTP